jgi:drug/metabolite transporter (DMT)-like permease
MSSPFSRDRARLTAALGAAAIALSSILVRLSHASPSTAAIFRCVDALPFLGLIAWREDRRLGSRSWRQRAPGLASGVFFAGDLILWNHSIGDVGAGLATVLANVQVVLLPLVAWLLLGERPARRVLAAIPVAVLGVLLISGVLEAGAYGRDPTRGTLFGLGAGVSYVGFLLLLRRGGADLRRMAGPLCDAVLVAAVLSILEGLVVGDARFVPTWPSAGWLALLAINSQVLGWLLIASSLPRLPTSVGSMLLLIQPIGSIALAAVIFGESPSLLQFGGVLFVLTALLAVSRSGDDSPVVSVTRPEALVRPGRPGVAPATADTGPSGS